MYKPAIPPRLTPADVSVHVVLHLPFLTGYAALRDTSAARPGDDLVLQEYSGELRADLLRSFPHRVHRYTPSEGSAEPDASPICPGSSVVWLRLSLDVDMWSIGAGLVTATYRLEAPKDVGWAELGPDVERGRHILKDRMAGLRAEALEDLYRAVQRGDIVGRPFMDARTGDREAEALWTHVTFLLEGEFATDLQELDHVAEALTWGGAEGPRSGVLGAVALRLALDSAVGYRPGSEAVAACLPRLIGVHTAVWAALTELDRRLLQLPEWTATRSLRSLERNLDRTMDTYEHARHLRAALESVTVHLSAVDRALWEALADTWGLATPVGTIDAKLESEQHVLSYAMASLTNRRARLLSSLALLFSVAGVVGVVGGLVDLSSKRLVTPHGANLWLLLAVVALVVALGLILWGAVLRSTERDVNRSS